MDRAVLAWSGGKDAALALSSLRRSDDLRIVELLTTFNAEHDRSTMHGVRRPLYERQATALDLPLNGVTLPPDPSNEEYESAMAEQFDRYRDRDVGTMVFADIFLEDVRAYRETQLADTDIEGRWPLWGRETDAVMSEFLDEGFKAIVVAVDGDQLDRRFVGRQLDAAFLVDLPSGVDPCGENGEFHTFVYDGPVFDEPVPVEAGDIVTREVGDNEFHYADLEFMDR